MANASQPQPTISSYFSPSPKKPLKRGKRPDSPIDLTSDNDYDECISSEEPPMKKIKVIRPSQSQPKTLLQAKSKKASGAYTQSTFFSQNALTPRRFQSQNSGTSVPASAGVAEQWAYTPLTSSSGGSFSLNHDNNIGAQINVDAQREKDKQHEAFKKKLLVSDNRFKLRSGVLSTPEVVDDVEDQRRTPSPVVEDADGSGSDIGSGFEEMLKMFARSEGKNRKGKARRVDKSVVQPPKQKTKKPPPKIGPSGKAYTPLELQVLELKEQTLGSVLMVEVGYKYKFYGDDAKVAAKELGMIAYTDRNFLVASIPIERLNVHLKKLLARGYRVAVAEQTETAALKKVSEDRNKPFARKIKHLYTAATYIDDLISPDDLQSHSPPPLMCLVEEEHGRNGEVGIGLVSICPSTGDVVWDDFEDSLMRIELETRLVHIRPAELLFMDAGISEPTNKILKYLAGSATTGDKLRTEAIKDLMTYTDAFATVTRFYMEKKKHPVASKSLASGKLLAEVTDFPKRVIIALAHAIEYLSKFGIADALLETKYFGKFTTQTHMLLAANTLINLEIFGNEAEKTTKGSLMDILNKTQTPFGTRLLKSWISRPLIDKIALQERIDAIEEILSSDSDKLMTLRDVLRRLKSPDLARGLCRIQYGQCTPKELSVLLPAFKRIGDAYNEFRNVSDVGFRSGILNEIIYSLPKLNPSLTEILDSIDLSHAAENKKDTLWTDADKYTRVSDADMSLQVVEMELQEQLKSIRKQLRMPSLQWVHANNEEFLIEFKKAGVPPIVTERWIKKQSTTKLARYSPPGVPEKVEERARCQEMLQAESDKAYIEFLKEISEKCYSSLRDAVNKLAVADCLLSLARVALEKNYVKPVFVDEDALEIIEGRHPMVEVVRDDPFVPNSVTMGFGRPENKIITGPNMGGKSSFVRMVALIVLMAQVGSYVPADSLRMGLLDSILTRMGASDDLAKGRSTFMIEMSETSEILHTATSRSLVILDELGRGTSTYDGMAIADGVLQQLVENTKCKTLFVTHYPLIATGIEKRYPKHVENVHMGYISDTRVDGTRSIIFLYKLTAGITTESFGIECARLAGLPEYLLAVAAEKGMKMQHETEDRMKRSSIEKVLRLVKQSDKADELQQDTILNELRELVRSLVISSDEK